MALEALRFPRPWGEGSASGFCSVGAREVGLRPLRTIVASQDGRGRPLTPSPVATVQGRGVFTERGSDKVVLSASISVPPPPAGGGQGVGVAARSNSVGNFTPPAPSRQERGSSPGRGSDTVVLEDMELWPLCPAPLMSGPRHRAYGRLMRVKLGKQVICLDRQDRVAGSR